MRARYLGLLALSLSLATARAATIINFDDLPPSTGGVVLPGGVTPFVGSTVPSDYSPYVTFSVPTGGLYVYEEASFWPDAPPASMPNVVCAAHTALASSAMCTEPLIVSFSQAVNNVSFWAGAWDDVGSLLIVQIFTGDQVLSGQLDILSPQRSNTQGVINVSGLSGILNITGLRIVSPSSSLSSGFGDRNGLVFDNFSFDLPLTPDPPSSVPEPSTLALAALGMAAGAWRRLRR